MTITLWARTRNMTQDRQTAMSEQRIEILRSALDHAFPLRVLDALLDRVEQGT